MPIKIINWTKGRFAQLAVLLLATVVLAACGSDDDGDSSTVTTVTTRDSGMVVTVQTAGAVTLHTLTAPEAVFANSTHLLETENKLVALDTQFL